MGTKEQSGDVEHRYQLRRALLCSRFFEPHVSRWDRMMSYTAPLLAGGMMVGVFTFMAANVSIEPEIGPQTISSKTEVAQAPSTSVEVTPIRVEDFLSSPDEPTVTFAARHVPLTSRPYVRTQ